MSKNEKARLRFWAKRKGAKSKSLTPKRAKFAATYERMAMRIDKPERKP